MSGEPEEAESIELDRNYQVRIGIAVGRDVIELVSQAPIRLRAGSAASELDIEAGSTLRFEPAETRPAECIYHVIVGTVLGGDELAAASLAEQWMERGYDVELLGRGAVLRAEDGLELDGRSILIAADRFATEQEARVEDRAIEEQGLNCWVAREVVEEAAGTVRLTTMPDGNPDSAVEYIFDVPVELECSAPVTVRSVDFGFWSTKVQDVAFSGNLEISIDPLGTLELIEQTTVEEYLRGVVPAEMPSSWPAAALEAQAVCARSETLSRLGVRHMGDDFDLCATEHCQAYRGASWYTAATDGAVQKTVGVVQANGSRLLEAVYSHNCGGHTEDNDVVWASPPDMALRGVPDAGPRALDGVSLKDESDLRKWLLNGTPAFCGHLKPDEMKNFRWNVKLSAREVDDLVAVAYPEVGRIRDIHAVERGVSGRMKSIRIVGRGATVVVLKELPIRRLFGGLYSAKFVVDIDRADDGMPAGFEFTGGGHGHGVGMCQDGARYLASSGRDYEDILQHYYGNAVIVSLYE